MMLVKFSFSLAFSVLYLETVLRRRIFTGAVQYEDEFQRSSFYTNEQGVSNQISKNLAQPQINSAKRIHEVVADRSSLRGYREPQALKNSGNLEGHIESSLNGARLQSYEHQTNSDSDNTGEIKSLRQNRRQLKRSQLKFDRVDKKHHYSIPNDRVHYVDGLDSQVANNQKLAILSREETRGLRQARKSFSDPVNTNRKWGFKRKQYKPEHGVKDVTFNGDKNHSPLYRHKEAMYSRNSQSDAMARSGHLAGDMLDSEANVARQNSLPINSRMMEQRNTKEDSFHRPLCNHRHEGPIDNFHRGVAQHKMESMPRPGASDVYFQKANPVQHMDSPSKVDHSWRMENPRNFNGEKYENIRANGVTNGGFQESFKRDNSLRRDSSKTESDMWTENQPMEIRQVPNRPLESMQVENQRPMEDTRNEDGPRMEEGRNGAMSNLEHQRVNDNIPRMEDQVVQSMSRIDSRYNSNPGMGVPRIDDSQRNENARSGEVHHFDNQRMEAGQRMDNAQRCDNQPVENNNWRDDSTRGITNVEKMKSAQSYYNNIPPVASPPKTCVSRLDSNPTVRGSGGPELTDEIRYLVFSPAEFSPMTLRTVLGESESSISQQIPHCTLEEYQKESASLRGKSNDSPNDWKMQYRGKGYINEVITRLKRKNQETRKNTRSMQSKTSPKCRERLNCPGMPVHCCTATTCSSACPTGLVVQTGPCSPEPRTTECYVDALTRSTETTETGLNVRITPSKLFENLRQRPIISNSNNPTHYPTKCTESREISKKNNITLPVLMKCKRTPDMALLTDIMKDIVNSNVTSTTIYEPRKRLTINVQEEKIIEKYLMALMDAQSNRLKNVLQERNPHQTGLWLEKLLTELAENKLKSKLRNFPKGQLLQENPSTK